MENLIFNELLIQGFNVDVGMVTVNKRNEEGRLVQTNHEVDFVCNEGSRRYYIQSSLQMMDDAKIKQETASLRNIDDSFKKIVIVGDETRPIRTEDGITIISIYDFLLLDNPLEI